MTLVPPEHHSCTYHPRNLSDLESPFLRSKQNGGWGVLGPDDFCREAIPRACTLQHGHSSRGARRSSRGHPSSGKATAAVLTLGCRGSSKDPVDTQIRAGVGDGRQAEGHDSVPLLGLGHVSHIQNPNPDQAGRGAPTTEDKQVIPAEAEHNYEEVWTSVDTREAPGGLRSARVLAGARPAVPRALWRDEPAKT